MNAVLHQFLRLPRGQHHNTVQIASEFRRRRRRRRRRHRIASHQPYDLPQQGSQCATAAASRGWRLQATARLPSQVMPCRGEGFKELQGSGTGAARTGRSVDLVAAVATLSEPRASPESQTHPGPGWARTSRHFGPPSLLSSAFLPSFLPSFLPPKPKLQQATVKWCTLSAAIL